MIISPKLPPDLPRVAAALESGLVLEEVTVKAPDWSAQTAARVSLDTVRLDQPLAMGARVRASTWVDVAISGGELAGADLTQSTWRRVAVVGGRFSGIIMPEADLRDVIIADCKLDLANFRRARLARVRFERCLLSEADFGGAQLSDVVFDHCDLTGVDLGGVLSRAVAFPGSTLARLSGIGGLSGCALSADQMIVLAPELAAALGIKRAG
jgi:uncharacterized protein YjbI with pentapeptide repeats